MMNNWVVVAVGKYIATENSSTGRCKCIGIDESTDGGVVITGLQVIEPGIGVVVVAARALKDKSQHRRYHDYNVILAAILLVVKRTMAAIRKFCQLAGPLLPECIFRIALLDACF